MDQTRDEDLRSRLAAHEAEMDRVADLCATHLRLPLSRADRRELDRALTSLSDRLRQATATANRIRFGRGAESPGDRQRSLAEVDVRMRKLARLIAALHRIMAARPQPLYPPEDGPRTLRSEQALASDRVFVALNRVVNPESQGAAAETLGCWPDIPLPPSRFLNHAHAAYRIALAQRRPQPLRFLDVGCGAGIKVLLAAEFFSQADGLEYDAGYAATARRVVAQAGRHPSQVIQADALTFDGFVDYDILYFYQPMKSPEGLRALEERIAARARPGTILIAPYALFAGRAEDLDCSRVAGAVYLAGTSAAEADAVRRRAERIGIEVPRPDEWHHRRAGYLRTLTEACHAVGYEVV